MGSKLTLDELEKEFEKMELPETLELSKGCIIIDLKKFLEVSFSTLRAQSGNKRFLPYYDRLVKAYFLIKK